MRLLSYKVNPRLLLTHGTSGGGASDCTQQSGDELTLSIWDKGNNIISNNIDNGTNPHRNRAVADAKRLIENGEYVGNSIDTKGRNRKYHYIKTDINGETSYIVIKEEEGCKTFYSITDKEDEP